MPTGKLTSFGLKAVDSDKWDGNIREAIAVAGKDGQKLVLLYNAVVAKAAVDDQVTNSATANYNGGADSAAPCSLSATAAATPSSSRRAPLTAAGSVPPTRASRWTT